ncbi:MAG: alpha/beta hydrolase family protein [Acidobacteriota bacterium]
MQKTKLISFICVYLLAAGPVVSEQFRRLDEPYKPQAYESLAEWLGQAAALRTRIWVSAGLKPLPKKSPLNPQISEPIEGDGYSVQNVALETYPGLYLTGNLYKPRGQEAHFPRGQQGPFPAVLSAHGHWKQGRLEDTELASIPGRAINLARQGYVVFSYSMIGYNENDQVIPHRFDDPRYQLWGFGPAGLQLWNSLRALDFLSSLPGVDPERIAMTGASGGGTQTYLFTAVEPRIKAAAPVNMISAKYQGGCICENPPLLRLEAINTELGALAAPRPLLMVSTSGDWTSDTPEIEFPAIRQIYSLFGHSERVANVHLDYKHNYNRESREAVYSWFARWLQGKQGQVLEQAFEVEESSRLLVELPGESLGLEPLFEQFAKRARGQIEAARPQDWRGINLYREEFGVVLKHALDSLYSVSLPEMQIWEPELRTQAGAAVLIVHPDDSEAKAEAQKLADDYQARGRLAFVLNPYPGGSKFAPPEDANHWTTYNPTVASRRVSEIRKASAEILRRPDVLSLDLVGLNDAGWWTLLARALLPSVRNTTIQCADQDPDSDAFMLENLFVPLLRRAGDFRTAAVAIAPAPLTLVDLPEGELREWFEDVYAAAGAPDLLRFESSGHLGE